MSTQNTQPQYTYKTYGAVNVLASEGSLSHIETDGGMDFWVRSADLKCKSTRISKADRLKQAAEAFKPYVPGTPYKEYPGAPDNPMVDWLLANLLSLTVRVAPTSFDRFAANLYHANGQEFALNMPGFFVYSNTGIIFIIALRADLPAEYKPLIEDVQERWGIRTDEPIADNPRVVYCNTIGWEMLRRGAKLG